MSRSPAATPQAELDGAPTKATEAVLVASEPVAEGAKEVRGIDFNQYGDRDITVKEMVAGMATTGFQSTSVAEAVRIINEMVCARSSIVLETLLTSHREHGEIPRLETEPLFSWATHRTLSHQAFARP